MGYIERYVQQMKSRLLEFMETGCVYLEYGDNNSMTKSSSNSAEEIESLKKLLETEKLSWLQEQLYNATGLGNSVIDLKGNILYGVGWKSICSEFHRKHKISSDRCLKSDTIIANRLKRKEKYSIYICQNGMVDAATPIIIEGVHVANLFIGQFFFEKPDQDFFIRQAEELGFDQEKYIKALGECQVYDKETILGFLDFFSELINVIGESAQKTIKQRKRATELIIANKELAFQSEEKEKRATELIIANKELALQNEKILYLSYHDFLTGLYNRSYFEAEIKRLDTARQLPISIIMGDINGLKLINDGFGYSIGDELLVEIAKILKSCCREEDIISRIGGDEFVILLPQTDSQSAQLIRSRISDACKGYALNRNQIYPSISLGHATKDIETETMDDILMAAEESMSKQKLLESKSAHSSIIASIKVIMFEKSHETEEHAERLVQLSKSIGLAMSLTDDQLNELELLSTLHDIGKMSINANVLSKCGNLSNEEWIEMRKHPEVGFRIAQATSELIPIANYILCHHERWDGKGYPQGLIGDNIPLLSRILAIVDSFDAMTNERPYRSAMTKGEAIEEIKRNSGSHFDPDIAQHFLNIISQELAL